MFNILHSANFGPPVLPLDQPKTPIRRKFRMAYNKKGEGYSSVKFGQSSVKVRHMRYCSCNYLYFVHSSCRNGEKLPSHLDHDGKKSNGVG